MLYRIEPGKPNPLKPGPIRDEKIPVHPYSLKNHNAHDSEAWVDMATAFALAGALGAQYGVAFTLVPGNNLFFIDIDECLGPDGNWTDVVHNLCSRFAGAAVEISHSGRGIHIIGRGAAPAHGCKSEWGFDLYTKKRFIALTGKGITGDVSTDHTAALHVLVDQFLQPKHGDGLAADWSTEPCAGWRGPTDDAELLRRALQSRNARSTFGGRAAFADIWENNEDVLTQTFPSNDHPGPDWSRVDAALAQYLAFWTGNNCERIERLMRQSAIAREKWDYRANYLADTITRAVGLQTDVLQDKLPEAVPDVPPAPAPAPSAAEIPVPVVPPTPSGAQRVTGSTFLSLEQQIELFQGCVYIYDIHRALVPGGHTLKPEQFRVKYGGYTFVMDDANQRTSRDAWEAFTQSQGFRVPRANSTCFRPDLGIAEIVQDGTRTLANVWWPAGVNRIKGDASPFLNHVKKLLPNERDQRILLSYVAACVQHLGVKFQWCPLLQGVEGNGKSLISRCAAAAVGNRYTHWPAADKLAAQFNAWMPNKVLACVEDIYVPESKRHIWEKLKPMITGDMQEIEAKGVDQDIRNIVVNFILNSNHKDAVRKTRNDRRLAIFYTAQQTAADVERDMGGSYMPEMYAWLKGEGPWASFGRNYGYAVVSEFLHTYPIDPEFNPAGSAHRAPHTSSTTEALSASLGAVELEVLEAIEQNLPGFRGGWISSMQLDLLLARTRMDSRISRNGRKTMLESLGYEWHPGLRDGRVNSDVMPDSGKPRLFIRRDHLARDMTGPAEIARAYMQAQA